MQLNKKSGKNIKYRFENFGGIIASEAPPFLAFVDRNYMRELNLDESPLWNTEDETVGLLSAPTEVHFAITNRCSVGCPHCYMDAGQPDHGELDTNEIKTALDILAEMGVFHLAMGGGEALERPDLFEIAEYARSIGLVPNLTVSGINITPEVATKMKVFGQVNVSIDGIETDHNVFRKKLFQNAAQALDDLIRAGVPTGINCVVGKSNFADLDKLFRYAKSKKINEIEFLRIKPAGRGKTLYFQERTNYEQNIALIPRLAELSEKYKVLAKIDCSFVPMFCYHNPPVDLLNAMATYGCEAGNVLLGIRSNGSVSGCSFLESSGDSVFDLPSIVKAKTGALVRFKNWTLQAPEPCRSCDYLDICKGGCHSVSAFVSGNLDDPDPDCPFVVEYHQRGEENFEKR